MPTGYPQNAQDAASRRKAATAGPQQALADLLDRLAGERGRLDTPEDEAEIARYMRLLGGMTEEPGEPRVS
jgi:hypothetical protein